MNGYIWLVVAIEAAQAAGFLALLVFVYLRSPGWTGMNHDARLRLVEQRASMNSANLDAMSGNQHRAYDEIHHSIGNVLAEVQKVQRQIAALQSLPRRVSQLEARTDDVEQRVSAFIEVGCGFSECPHRKAAVGET